MFRPRRQRRTLSHAEAVLLVGHRKHKIEESHAVGYQRVRADDHAEPQLGRHA